MRCLSRSAATSWGSGRFMRVAPRGVLVPLPGDHGDPPADCQMAWCCICCSYLAAGPACGSTGGRALGVQRLEKFDPVIRADPRLEAREVDRQDEIRALAGDGVGDGEERLRETAD